MHDDLIKADPQNAKGLDFVELKHTTWRAFEVIIGPHWVITSSSRLANPLLRQNHVIALFELKLREIDNYNC